MVEEAPLMVDIVPELAAEMERELRASGEAELAEQVAGLRMTRSCGCGDEFCASFYTGPNPKESWEGDRRAVALPNLLILDVRNAEIGFVEVLYRDDLRPRILTVFGEDAAWRLTPQQGESS
jgi:hypothetical protein